MMLKKLLSIALAAGLLLPLLSLLARPLPARADTGNLIANNSVETADSTGKLPLNWQHDSWGSNTASFTYKASGGYQSTRALQVKISSYADGDAKWYFNPVNVTAGQRYAFADYYKATVPTELVAQETAADGSISYQWLGEVPAVSGWHRAATYVMPDAGTQKLTIFHLLDSVGTLITDNYSLQTAAAPTVTNGIGNNSVEQASDVNPNQPLGWQTGSWGSNNATFTYPTTGEDGSRSVKVVVSNYVDGDAKWYFDPVAVTPNANYVFADYYKATVSTDVVAQFSDSAGTISYQWLGTAQPTSSWKRAAFAFTTPANVANVTVLHVLAANGSLQTDNFSLLPAQAIQTVNGVPNGNLEQASELDLTKPAAWQTGNWGTNTVKFSYLTSGGHNGSRAAQVAVSKYTDGDAKWYYNPVAIIPGQTYQVSDWYTSTIDAQVVMQIGLSDGNTQYLQLKPASATSTWAQYSDSFTAPANAQTVTMLHLIAGVGTLTTDDYGLQAVTPVGFTRPLVSVTFDDGWQSIYANGLPLLQQYGIDSTQFIITGVIGNDPQYMTLPELKTMVSDGEEIGSHTVTHPDLTTLSADQVNTELTQSKQWLESNLGISVTDFATPYGSYNTAVLNAIAQVYASQRGVEGGYNAQSNTNVYDLKVQDITSTTTTADVQNWLNEAKATNTWLILVYHGVDNSGDVFNITPQNLSAQLAAIKNSGLTTATIHQGLSEITPQLGH